jgi:hypothetical protein
MKSPRIPFIFTILLLSFSTFSQKEIIKLNLEEGKSYVFELNSTLSEFDITGHRTIKEKSKSEICFEVEKFDGRNLVFAAKVTSTVNEYPDSKVKSILNQQFPPVVSDINKGFNPISVVVQLLSMTGLRYKIDLKSNAIKFLNKSEVLDSVRKFMHQKGYNEEFITKGIEFMKQDNIFWHRIHETNRFILHLNQSSIIDGNSLKNKLLIKDFQLNNNEEFVYGKKDPFPGSTYSDLKISNKYGFPLYYFEARHDSIREQRVTKDKYSRLTETEFSFLKEFPTREDLFTFECTIENPKDSFITIFYLDKPFGAEYTRKVLKLDKNNQVKFQTKLYAPSFLYFLDRYISYSIDFSSMFFYVEPNDTLVLNLTNSSNSKPFEISGTSSFVNQVIRDAQREQQFLKTLHYLNRFDFETRDVFNEAENLHENLDLYLKRKKIKLDEKSYIFLKNELIALEYTHYFLFLNRYYADVLRVRTKSKTAREIDEEKEMVRRAEQKISDFDIHNHYNDYGIYSRKLSLQYFHYYLNNTSRISYPQNNLLNGSIQKEFEIGKMILGGSVFYRVLADRITSTIMRNYSSALQIANYELYNSIALIDKLVSQSNSEHYKKSLLKFRETRLNWEKENYIPETTFYKPDGSTVSLQELIGGKPTIFYANQHEWGSYRYAFDKEATDNPDIRYVMIMQGDNLEKWQDYIERAEPVAEQLLMLKSNTNLADIFLSTFEFYLVYGKDGKLLKYDAGKYNFTKIAKQNLEQKKELNKSQLQTIIVTLLTILVLLTMAIIIWKWRARQRFRKEEQQRRLRELELTAIRSQMNPHFLFNSLNSVQNLVQQNKGREAHLYLSDFAGLIRKVLQNSEKEEVSLAEELEMVEQYLCLEKLRFDFDYSINIEDKIEKYSTVVPSNILQPVVENAIIHGLNHKPDNRILKINVQLVEEGIKITVEDNGIGRKAAAEVSKSKNGRGLKLVQERLQVLQEKQREKYNIEIIDLNENETGTLVEILIPDDI